jgi:hypothetical protein
VLDVHDAKLGRRYAADAEDWPAARFIDLEQPKQEVVMTRSWRYWYERFNENQTGGTCVSNTGAHILGDSPHTHTLADLTDLVQHRLPDRAQNIDIATYHSGQSGQTGVRGYMYDQAQLYDEFADTPPEGGTSGRAWCKVAQSLGLVSSYLWLNTAEEVALAVLNHGPVGLGCWWYADDYYGVHDGSVLRGTGARVGGHEVALSYVSMTKRVFKVQTWGIHLYLPFTVLEQLLAEDGDAFIVTEPA